METLKTLFINRFKMMALLSLSLTLSIVLLMVRAKLHQSFYLLFLVWNLFLAVIPFAITTIMVSKPKMNKLTFLATFMIWLLFLPNAPYITTDLFHISNSNNSLLWLDVLVILSFALNGLILFYLSLLDMEELLVHYIRPKLIAPIVFTVFGLTAFGIYLGRFLRYNSWEIINQPSAIFSDTLKIIVQPNTEAWLFTIMFGCFLGITYWLLKSVSLKA
ncbi:DUF1361 domain-containing protein [Psychroserpens sp. XS_ASV72]|uniref:DUF1361 domain-containing protein n=1 Tax=Psychroserpens sp. XS_ASV72 TaxID=3241293 RepID=UPI003514D371